MLNNFFDIAIALLLYGVGLAFGPQTSFAPLARKEEPASRPTRGSCDSRARVRCWRAELGWPLYDAMFLAAVLSIGSTAILVKVLEDMGRMESTSAILVI
jgi:monovalent cation:H+ antiporter-2, CPA2 family